VGGTQPGLRVSGWRVMPPARVLFLTPRLPFPPVGGDRLRAFHFLKRLKARHRVVLAAFVERRSQLEDARGFEPFYDRLRVVVLPKAVSYARCLLGLASRRPLQVHYYRSPKMARVVREELARGCDVLYSHLVRMAQYVPEDPRVRTVVDLTDAISLNYERAKKFRSGVFSLINRVEAPRILAWERAMIRRADRSILISEVDARHLRRGADAKRVVVIGNGVDVSAFPFRSSGYDADQIVFFGQLRYFPNVDGVRWFVNEVLPIIAQSRPATRLLIVGAEPPASVRRLADGERIVVTGFVPSIIPSVQGSAVSLAPLRVGAGVQNKILESLALGTPVVATSIAAEGLDARCLAVGDSPVAFAARVLELLGDPVSRAARSQSGRAYVEANFPWDKVLAPLDSLIDSVV